MDYAQDFTFDQIKEDSEFLYHYTVDDAAYYALSSIFQDKSPIHIDDEYAKSLGFSGRVMHGAIFQGFLSHFIGMRFPGKHALLLSVNMNYHRPAYLGDKIQLTARVRQKVEAKRVVVLDVKFLNQASQIILASGRVQVAIRHE